MSFLKNIFSKKEEKVKSYNDFWNWFLKYERDFFNVVKQKGDIERLFFDKLSFKLNELKDGFFYLTGISDDSTVELIITADGEVKNIIFVEELVAAAPQITGWKFIALKPAIDLKDVYIKMAGFEFKSENIHFYANVFPEYPDEIDITIVHDDFNEENRNSITNGTYIFLDNYLGELAFATTVDNLTVTGRDNAEDELIPIEKLASFLAWRQKEFIEKYEGSRHNTDDDTYTSFTADLDNGNKLMAVINTDILNWGNKASHPWILDIELKYNGEHNRGMPDNETYELLEEIENQISAHLKDFEGFINVGRQTADSVREIYFACRDFRQPSKVLQKIQTDYLSKIEISYSIYKDKYWQSFNRFDSN